MRHRRFIQCDVFTATPTRGNGLAVVVEADGMTDAQMQDFAAWTNLAETTFLLPPTDPAADYRVRIFTPKREMLFAGHPTLGSCAAWLHAGGRPANPHTVLQECAIGLVAIDQTGPVPAFVAPPTKIAPLPQDDHDRIVATLGIDPATITASAQLENGPVWKAFALRHADDVLTLDAARLRYPDFRAVGLIGPHDPGHGADYEVRNIAPSSGMVEDPITGSLNAALACWMKRRGTLPAQATVAQGTRINRQGRVHISTRDDDILIGGQTHILIDGTVDI
ncbi:PhzF family phenazine biosynthesis protein [Actibacterium sp. 188UL27-1]|uniref:PhzF family phenazine biosynthesis protein n=1 Tax=Actibacterium sp. 188UL27-1 TaxID=2786961 RepID=UPI00195CDAA9|nr:PhzF family phenazine biosynthesis protein [Actibacterium sp. 188UL27-1]MBM7070017.1 PhzF family phenazine biosynthesis protein [Actibacterium sp. 188UL27-1]